MQPTLLEGPFTVAEYHRLAELGILHEDDRVELLDGKVVVMTPIGPRHAGCVDRLTRLFSLRASDLAAVRVQSPVVLGERAEPEPDVSLLRLPIERYASAHPRPVDVMLIIEVADTSLDYDRDVKLPLYASAGIPEVWLVDLEGERITLHRAPGPDGYRDVTTASRGHSITPRLLPDGTLAVDEILG
jgi:Uma2 family endonuclease